jgi:hypothetical protein
MISTAELLVMIRDTSARCIGSPTFTVDDAASAVNATASIVGPDPKWPPLKPGSVPSWRNGSPATLAGKLIVQAIALLNDWLTLDREVSD